MGWRDIGKRRSFRERVRPAALTRKKFVTNDTAVMFYIPTVVRQSRRKTEEAFFDLNRRDVANVGLTAG